MKAKPTNWRILIAILVTITLATGLIVSVLVFATGDSRLTVTGYSDLIRFAAEGVATLQVRIFDLSGKEVWDSGVVSGGTVDWNRNNDFGERLAYGAYIYSAQGWNASGDVIFQKNGKLALMPGDQVQLQAAPSTPLLPNMNAPDLGERPLQPMGTVGGLGDTGIFGQVGIGTESPGFTMEMVDTYSFLRVLSDSPTGYSVVQARNSDGDESSFIAYSRNTAGTKFGHPRAGLTGVEGKPYVIFGIGTSTNTPLFFATDGSERMRIDSNGNVGIGTTSPTAKLEIESSSGQDLIAAYPSSSRVAGSAVFVVKSTGEVRADGAYYSGAGDCNTGGFNAGGADVAERINTSEWVEPGNVVEIDPEHPGFFRKSSSPYSTKVAGIISTSPGVILGNNFDEATDDWEDNRPVLAIAGRVPLQVTAENGPIQIGDLLVSSSTPGVAMKGADAEACMGAVIGKAMEPLKEGTGTIVVQVMLR